MYICGIYTCETNKKKYGTYLITKIKQIANKMKIIKISLLPVDDKVVDFYIKNNFYLNNVDNFYYFDICYS